MDKYTQQDQNNLDTLADDARALIAATADIAGDKVGEARKRLTTALESSKRIIARVHGTALEGAKITDRAVRDKPYQAMAVAFGVGAVIGYLVTRRCCSKAD